MKPFNPSSRRNRDADGKASLPLQTPITFGPELGGVHLLLGPCSLVVRPPDNAASNCHVYRIHRMRCSESLSPRGRLPDRTGKHGTASDPAGQLSRTMAKDDRKVVTHERILNAAVNEFARHGFADASVDMIARRAQVAHGTVFAHFGRKADVFAAAARLAGEQFVRTFLSLIHI